MNRDGGAGDEFGDVAGIKRTRKPTRAGTGLRYAEQGLASPKPSNQRFAGRRTAMRETCSRSGKCPSSSGFRLAGWIC
jgi:hypothetical protein